MDLRKSGVYPYACHHDTDVWVAAYAWGDEDIQVWIPPEPCPPRIIEHVESGGRIYAWNTMFERIVWRYLLGPRYDWPLPKLEQWHDPMVWALSMALPAALEQCASALRLPISKDLDGRRLMRQMARPRSENADGTYVWWDDAGRRARLTEYCRMDVEVERELCRHLLPLSAQERQYWLLDQRINDRGVRLDLEFVRAAQDVVTARMEKLNAQMEKVTQGHVTAATQIARLGQWLIQRGHPMESLDKEAIANALSNPLLPSDIDKALRIRQAAARSSNAKLDAMEEVAGADGRARGCFLFHRAGTGRWASVGIQLHNLPRGDKHAYPVDNVVREAMRRSDDWLEVAFGDPLEAISSALRGAIVASPRNTLVCCDYKQIEARINAFLAGHDAITQAFAQDVDVYTLTAEGVGSDNRTLGKVLRLACGFGMGAERFKETAETYGLELSLDEATKYIELYREQDAPIVAFWNQLASAALTAVAYAGKTYEIPCGIRYRMAGRHLWARLLSGRTLCYPFASIEDRKTPWGEVRPTLKYWGINSYTKRWEAQWAYGGLHCENIVQATAADVLREAIAGLEERGHPVVAHIHDEVIAEVPLNRGDLAQDVVQIVSRCPDWLTGCPVAVDTLITPRYRKG